MHRMYKWFLTAAAVCLLGVSAVAVAEDSYYLELPTKGVTSSRKITVDVPGENPVEDGVNPLTGESWYGNYYPILVNIDAHPEALPHWGVASADISYEMPVQADGSTRSAMLFMGTIPAYAGPVRSGRVPMGSLREIWGGAWVFYGWQNWANGNNTICACSNSSGVTMAAWLSSIRTCCSKGARRTRCLQGTGIINFAPT